MTIKTKISDISDRIQEAYSGLKVEPKKFVKQTLQKVALALLAIPIAYGSMAVVENRKAEALMITPTQIGDYQVMGEVTNEGVGLIVDYTGGDGNDLRFPSSLDLALNYIDHVILDPNWTYTTSTLPNGMTNYHFTNVTDPTNANTFAFAFDQNALAQAGITDVGDLPNDALANLTIGYAGGDFSVSGNIGLPTSIASPATPVPEPNTLLLLASGLGGLAGVLGYRRKERAGAVNYKAATPTGAC